MLWTYVAARHGCSIKSPIKAGWSATLEEGSAATWQLARSLNRARPNRTDRLGFCRFCSRHGHVGSFRSKCMTSIKLEDSSMLADHISWSSFEKRDVIIDQRARDNPIAVSPSS